MSPLVFTALAVLLVLLVSGGYVFFVACRRQEDIPWLDEQAVAKTPYAKYYPNILEAEHWLRTHEASDLFMHDREGLKLHAVWVPAENAKGTVLFAHGYRSTMLVDFGLAFEFYHSMGMNLLIPEHRCHGQSQGSYITFGVKESQDMLEWLELHNRQLGAYPVLLSGLSMGASTVMYMADEQLPENVRAIIADCGFTSPWDIISAVFKKTTHLPAWPVMWAAELFARLFGGFSLRRKDTRKTLPHNRLPIFMVHGLDDDFVPCDMTKQGYAVCGGEKELLLVEGAGHGVSFLKERERYSRTIMKFLKQYIGGFE